MSKKKNQVVENKEVLVEEANEVEVVEDQKKGLLEKAKGLASKENLVKVGKAAAIGVSALAAGVFLGRMSKGSEAEEIEGAYDEDLEDNYEDDYEVVEETE